MFDPILSERREGKLWEETSVLVRWGPMVAGGESGCSEVRDRKGDG